jgi:predicted PurR-regulated permease PerM
MAGREPGFVSALARGGTWRDVASTTPASSSVPWRRCYAAVFAVLSVAVGVVMVVALRRVLIWLVVAVFFAVVLAPAVDRVERWLHLRRGLAVALVVVAAP